MAVDACALLVTNCPDPLPNLFLFDPPLLVSFKLRLSLIFHSNLQLIIIGCPSLLLLSRWSWRAPEHPGRGSGPACGGRAGGGAGTGWQSYVGRRGVCSAVDGASGCPRCGAVGTAAEWLGLGGFELSAFSGLLLSDIVLHSDHHFPAPSSKLIQTWLHHWKGTLYFISAQLSIDTAVVRYSATLWPSLSSTFLQIHPDLVMPLKGHSSFYFCAAVHWRCQHPPEGLGTNKTGSNVGLKHLPKHEECPPWVRKEFYLKSNDFGLSCADVSDMGSYKTNTWYNLICLLQPSCHLITNEKLSVSWQISETCGVMSGGSGCRMDVVNQCLEFDASLW